jgi:hypothetical protein
VVEGYGDLSALWCWATQSRFELTAHELTNEGLVALPVVFMTYPASSLIVLAVEVNLRYDGFLLYEVGVLV